MYGKADAKLMTGDEDRATRSRRTDHKSMVANDIVALLLMVLLALALVTSEANAGEPEGGIDRAELLADFRNASRPDATAVATEVLDEIRSSALSGADSGGDVLHAATVEPSEDEVDDVGDLFVEVTAKRRPSDDIVASNDDSLRF
jgi:hypothetical protein